MKKLILNFKSKDSKKIKDPKNFLGGKGANLSESKKVIFDFFDNVIVNDEDITIKKIGWN